MIILVGAPDQKTALIGRFVRTTVVAARQVVFMTAIVLKALNASVGPALA